MFCGIDARILDFFIKGRVNKNNQINFVIYKFTFQGLERNIDVGVKKRTLFDVLIRF
jgi:hypothetical protein